MGKASSRELSTKTALSKCLWIFIELMECHCVPGIVLGSGDGEMNESFFALTGALDLVEEKGM